MLDGERTMKNVACYMEGGLGMAYPLVGMIADKRSRAAGLILVYPDKGVFY